MRETRSHQGFYATPSERKSQVFVLSAKEVWTSLLGTFQGLGVPPLGDGSVVAGQQDRGHVSATPAGRLGVVGVFQQQPVPGCVGLLDEGLGVTDDAGKQPHNRLRDGQDRHLAPVEHIVAEANLDQLVGIGAVVKDPLIDPLVTPTSEQQPLFPA